MFKMSNFVTLTRNDNNINNIQSYKLVTLFCNRCNFVTLGKGMVMKVTKVTNDM